MNNLKSARELKFQNYIREKLNTYNQASSSSISRKQSVNKSLAGNTLIKAKLKGKKISNYEKKIAGILKRNLRKYNADASKYYTKIVNNIIYDEKKHIVAIFKEYLLWDETSDFLKRFYYKLESVGRLPQISGYYVKYTLITPVFFKLTCNTIMMKNAKKKKKYMEMLEENEDQANNREKKCKANLTSQYSKLIKTTVIDEADNHKKPNPTENIASQNESSITLNCDLIEKHSPATQEIINLSYIINNLSLNASIKDDSNLLEILKTKEEACFSKEAHTKTPSHATEKKTKTETLIGSKPKKIEIKKLDLRNIQQFNDQLKPTEFTEKINTTAENHLALPKTISTVNRKISSKPNVGRVEYVKKKFDGIETMLQVLSFPCSKVMYSDSMSNHLSNGQKASDCGRTMRRIKTSKGGMLSSIKRIMSTNVLNNNHKLNANNNNECDTQIKKMVIHNEKVILPKSMTALKKGTVQEFIHNPLQIFNSHNTLSNYAKQAPLVKKNSNVVIGLNSNTNPSSVYNINLNLNLNLNLNMQNKHLLTTQGSKIHHESIRDYVGQVHTCPNSNSNEPYIPHTDRQSTLVSKNKSLKQDRILLSNLHPDNKTLSRNVNEKNFILNYQSSYSTKIKKLREKIAIPSSLNKGKAMPIQLEKMQSQKKISLNTIRFNLKSVDNNRQKKYPLTSRNEKEGIPMNLLNKVFHK